MRFWVVLAAAFLMFSCKGGEPEAPVSDPRAYILDLVKQDDSRCFDGKKEYCVDGDIEAVLDDVIERFNMAPLSSKASTLRRNADRVSMTIKSNATSDPKRRAELEALIEKRFRNPKTKVVKHVAFGDFSHVPGKFVKALRGPGMTLKSDESYATVTRPKGKAVAEAIEAMRKAHPDANVWAMRLRTNGDRWKFIFGKDGQLTMIRGGNIDLINTKISDDLKELRASEAWADDRTSCNTETAPARCRGALPMGGFEGLE